MGHKIGAQLGLSCILIHLGRVPCSPPWNMPRGIHEEVSGHFSSATPPPTLSTSKLPILWKASVRCRTFYLYVLGTDTDYKLAQWQLSWLFNDRPTHHTCVICHLVLPGPCLWDLACETRKTGWWPHVGLISGNCISNELLKSIGAYCLPPDQMYNENVGSMPGRVTGLLLRDHLTAWQLATWKTLEENPTDWNDRIQQSSQIQHDNTNINSIPTQKSGEKIWWKNPLLYLHLDKLILHQVR